MSGGHYRYFFTEHFGLPDAFYADKRILDVGCGPRGSLEWATMARQRVGLDPLVRAYAEFGIDRHDMSYVEGGAEAIPFPDHHFDVVSSINSLDHVDDIPQAVAELTRVLAHDGTLLLICEVGHPATATEPQEFGFEILDAFVPPLVPIDVSRLRFIPEAGVLGSCLAKEPLPGDQAHGILSARLAQNT